MRQGPILLSAAFLAIAAAAPAGELPRDLAAFPQQDMDEVRLGRLLFYDPILSGGQGVACATCHHPRFATSDGLSLGLGDGATGLGPERHADPANMPEERVPRNATALFNLGAPQFTRMFHDGRLEADPSRPSGLRTPLEDDMVTGFDSVLSAQAMFPVLSPDEMAGHYAESDVSKAVRQGFLTGDGGAWDIIASRVAAIPEYRAAFDRAIGPDRPIHFTDIANMIAAFIAFEWRADESPFDRYLRDGTPMDAAAMAGMELFYGKAGCGDCHSGQFQTDHDFHAIAMPQIGPGKKGRFESHFRDLGRLRVTGDDADAYRFRTPPLRNVALTAPYGHDGAYATLEGVVRHHLDPVAALRRYDPSQAVLPELAGHDDFPVLADPEELARIAAANELEPVALSDAEVAQIVAFLEALTDPVSIEGRLGVPERVPSGLPVDQ
ncbi:cytochrome c peroxidase [Psychromarinibacter sp. C21-152]|uniref:Cytochrome c peroxidase n=1 Tax=Psychromarinibacter sediminicola TaxID=3033385 RepID=A0AAE3T7V0_9RHOB|nr:cytochrome c peroxidase [Psychromarinibacter sediminicola]MDF0599409.1 cytochrome c peroxidase [Psychromarinibacter sediminicola]